MYRILGVGLFLFVCSASLGCAITYLMSDRMVYGIEGEIREQGSGKSISSVKVNTTATSEILDK